MKPIFYAVRCGKNPGIYRSWKECEIQVKGFPGARFRKFSSWLEAKQYVTKNTNRPESRIETKNSTDVIEEIMGKDSEPLPIKKNQPETQRIHIWIATNPNKLSFSVVFEEFPAHNCSGTSWMSSPNATQLGLAALIRSMSIFLQHLKVPLHSYSIVLHVKSKYLFQNISEWVVGLSQRDHSRIRNKELFKMFFQQCSQSELVFLPVVETCSSNPLWLKAQELADSYQRPQITE